MLPPETRNIVMPRKFITNIIINYIWIHENMQW